MATALANPDLKLGGIISLAGHDYTGYGTRNWKKATTIDSPILLYFGSEDYSYGEAEHSFAKM